MDDGEFGVARSHDGEHARPADDVAGLGAGVTGDDLADPGQVELVDHSSGFDAHRQIIALIGLER